MREQNSLSPYALRIGTASALSSAPSPPFRPLEDLHVVSVRAPIDSAAIGRNQAAHNLAVHRGGPEANIQNVALGRLRLAQRPKRIAPVPGGRF